MLTHEYIRQKHETTAAAIAEIRRLAESGDVAAIDKLTAMCVYAERVRRKYPEWLVTHPWWDIPMSAIPEKV